MKASFFSAYRGQKTLTNEMIPFISFITTNGEASRSVQTDYEMSRKWKAIPFLHTKKWSYDEWDYSPVRFIDGKDVGKTAARILSPNGFPIPVRGALIGAISMVVTKKSIIRELFLASRAVAFCTKPFPGQEIIQLSQFLESHNIKLLPVRITHKTKIWKSSKISDLTEQQTRGEMFKLERDVLAAAPQIPSLVDGRLASHLGGFDYQTDPVFGLIKTHHNIPLNISQILLLFSLMQGERMPAFVHTSKNGFQVLTWYLRLNPSKSQSILDGVVRLEVALDWYEKHARHTNFINQLSKAVYMSRCTNQHYGRAGVSLEPIVQGEDRLGAVLGSLERFISEFYYLTQMN